MGRSGFVQPCKNGKNGKKNWAAIPEIYIINGRIYLSYSSRHNMICCSALQLLKWTGCKCQHTLIVYDADYFGLSQLYQLRGRVGRSNRMAYAYFTYKRDKILNEIAEKRLQAIKEFTEFGSGFKIAMRDMEIRGTGNLLGAEQHGQMAAVGYDLYCKMLAEAVQEMKGVEVPKPVDTVVDIKVDAYIDSRYISGESHKLQMYKRIAAIEGLDDKYDVEDEMIDRFEIYLSPPKISFKLLI